MSKHEIGCLKHCPGGGDGGGFAGVVVLIILGAVAYGAYHVRRGIATGVHVAVVGLEVLLAVAAVSAGIAVLSVAAYATVRVCRAIQRKRASQAVISSPHKVIRLGPAECQPAAVDARTPAAIGNSRWPSGTAGWQPYAPAGAADRKAVK